MGAMTLVEARYRFTTPFQESFTAAIQAAHAQYGLRSVKLEQNLEGLSVLFDASRLTVEDLDHSLHSLSLPVVRIEE